VPHSTPASAKRFVPQVALTASQRSSTSQLEAAARQTRLRPSRLQVPSTGAPALTLQASQSPPQALVQHTPSEQKVDPHSTPVPHPVPLGFLAEQ
jgi:hypothetical protein